MKHYFVRFHVAFPLTLDFPSWEAEQGLKIAYEHAIEYGSDITDVEQIVANQLFHQRAHGNPEYYLKHSPQPTVWLIDWRELLGDHRPDDTTQVKG